MLEADGVTVRKWFEPGAPVRVPVKDYLEISGLTMDTPLTTTVPNVLPAPAQQFPIARVTGMDFQVTISYHNKYDKGNMHYSSDPEKENVAYIRAVGEVRWNSQQRLDFGETPPGPDGTGLYRSRYMYNTSFKFIAVGSYVFSNSELEQILF